MATPVDLPWMNRRLGGPSPNSKVGVLPIHTDGRVCTSVWQLSDEEIARIVETRCIVLQVVSGETQPPIGITTIQKIEA